MASLKECSRSRDIRRGMEIHALAADSGLLQRNSYVANSLINMYAKCSSMNFAKKVFDGMIHRDIVSWNVLLQGYVENGESELALKLFFKEMNKVAVPDARTFVAALSACVNLAAKEERKKAGRSSRWLEIGKQIHSQAVSSKCCDMFVTNRLVDMYCKCGSVKSAREVFDGLIKPDVVSWTALLQGYVENDEGERALELFQDMTTSSAGCVPDARTYVVVLSACATLAANHRSGSPSKLQVRGNRWIEKGREIHSRAVESNCKNIFVENVLIDFYAKSGSMAESRSVFDQMVRRDVVSWTALATGYAENGENEAALEVVDFMAANGVGKNSLTYAAALMACGNLMAVERGQAVHAEIQSCGLEQEVMVANCLVDFYGKCGSMDSAKQVFDSIKRKTIVSWNSLMCGYSLQGDTDRVFRVFERMKEQGVAADQVTFVCLLSDCSHAGLTDKGKEFFSGMSSGYGVTPSLKHYVCMIDLLGRANLLEEAMKVLRSMPIEAEVVTWTAILCACQKWKNAAVGRVAYEALLELGGARDVNGDASAYVLMASVYKGCGAEGETWWTDETGKVHKYRRGRPEKSLIA